MYSLLYRIIKDGSILESKSIVFRTYKEALTYVRELRKKYPNCNVELFDREQQVFRKFI